MRRPRYSVLIVLVAMLGGTVGMVAMRDRPARAEAKERVIANEPARQAADAGASASASADAGAEPALVAPLDRPLRTVGLGWDTLVPGLLSSDDDASANRGMALEFRSVARVSAVKEALTRGGEADGGADIAVLPLPEMVAAYEDLRALEPRIFMLVGWSRGREALYGRGQDLLSLPRRGKIGVMAQEGSAASFLALFALDAAGVPPERVTIVPSSLEAKLVAKNRALDPRPGDAARLLMTTADADHLVPLVAVVPKGLASNQEALRVWARAWQRGTRELGADVPGSARSIASRPGAPKSVELVRKLGLIEFADLSENARRMGLAGRDPVTLDRLFVHTWGLWRRQGLLITPAPAVAPLDTSVVTSLLIESPEREPARKVGSAHFDTRIILRAHTGKPGSEASRDKLALIAGAFSRSGLRVSVNRSKRSSEAVVDGLGARFGISSERFELAPRLSRRRAAVLEVLAAP